MLEHFCKRLHSKVDVLWPYVKEDLNIKGIFEKFYEKELQNKLCSRTIYS